MTTAAPSAEPLDDADFGRLFASLRDVPVVIAAVSGGADSTALMHGLAVWREGGAGPEIVVATIDHGLRAASAGEARAVARAAEALGLASRILRWEGPKPRSGMQERARAERYRLLDGLAVTLGASHLLTAHTLDDQAETLLMRMARGSGPAGLAGMRPMMWRGPVVHARPLLGVAKAALVATCRERGWPTLDDPSNRDRAFTRVRWRDLMPGLAAEGLTGPRLARLAQRMERAEAALATLARIAFERALIPGDEGAIRLSAPRVFAEPDEIGIRVLGLALATLGAGAPEGSGLADPASLRLDRLESGFAALKVAHAAGLGSRRTLGGCQLTLGGTGEIAIGPERERRRGRAASTTSSGSALVHLATR